MTIETYSQRNLNPYSGQVQIAESDRARAVSMDGETWEIHLLRTFDAQPAPVRPEPKGLLARFIDYFGSGDKVEPPAEAPEPRRVFARFGHLNRAALQKMMAEGEESADQRILELARFITTASLPFPARDKYECWLLDSSDGFPLALIHSCAKLEEQENFPSYPEWTALPAAIMPIDSSGDDQQTSAPPINHRFERLVAQRAGTSPKASWFERHSGDDDGFPPLLVREDWQNEEQNDLCQRYLQRQSPRLLMLHGLKSEDRKRMELASRAQALEVSKFFDLYPDVADPDVMKSIRVEARLRESRGEKVHSVKFRWS